LGTYERVPRLETELGAEEDYYRLKLVAGGDLEDIVLHDRGRSDGLEADDN
jgi:hypothetical protein